MSICLCMWTTCALGSVFFCVSGCLDNISLREDYIDHPTTKQHVSCRFNTLGYLFLIKPRSFSFLTFMHLHFICILCVGVGVSLDLSVHVKLNLPPRSNCRFLLLWFSPMQCTAIHHTNSTHYSLCVNVFLKMSTSLLSKCEL